VRFGLDYIELISIYDRGEIEARGEPNALALSALLDRSEGGLLGFALASDDIEADGRRLRQAGFLVDGPTPMERLRPDGRLLRWRLLVPRGGSWGTPLPFIIQWDNPDEQRLEWERPGAHANGCQAVAALAITVSDLGYWADIYSAKLGLELLASDRVAALNADRASFRIGTTQIDLLSALPGGIADAGANGEQPWQVALECGDVTAASRLLRGNGVEPEPAPGTEGGLLIPPASAMGARLVLQPPMGA
jgi:hypothetical protein